MLNPNNKFEFNSYYDTDRISKGLNSILYNHNSNNNFDTNSKLTYSSFLGEKEEESYQDLLTSLIKDQEFIEMYSEFKDKEKIIFDFQTLEEDKKVEMLIKCFFILKSQKDQVIEEYWKVKNDNEEKQKIAANTQIEKYKNEAYMYKCERDELKIQLNNLKTKKDSKEKEVDKILSKCEKYKERMNELEKNNTKLEAEKKEMEVKYNKEISEVKAKYEKLLKEFDNNTAKLRDLEDEHDNCSRRIEDFKMKCEILSGQVRDLNERNIRLQRISKKNMYSNNFTSGTNNEGGMALAEIVMTENNQEVKQAEKPSQYTVSMKLNVKEIKNSNRNVPKAKEEEKKDILTLSKSSSAILKQEILINKVKSKVNNIRDPNRISCFIEDDSAELCETNNEAEEDLIDKDYLDHTSNNSHLGVKDKIDTIHCYESQVSLDNSYESGSVSNNTESNFVTEMNSEMDSNNMNSENSQRDFQTDTFDTLRQFQPKKMDADMFGSNKMKY